MIDHPPRSAPSPRAEDVLRILNAFAVSMLQQRSLDDLLWSIADNAGRLLGFEDCVVYLVRPDGLHQRAAFGVKNPRARDIRSPLVLPLGVGVVGTVASTSKARLVADTRTCAEYVSDEFPGCSELAVPVVHQEHVIAVLDSESSRPNAFDEHTLRLLQSIANIAAPRIAFALEEAQREDAERKLKRAKDELEERVQQRTRKLVQTVRYLQTEILERKRVERELERERRLLRLTLDSIENGLLATDAEGRVLLASAAALRMTGCSLEEVQGAPLEEVYLTAEVEGPLGARASSGAGPGLRRMRDSAGDERFIKELRGPIPDHGEVIVFRDVTNELTLEREAQTARHMESLGLLAAGIAHDFNNVLTSILGSVSLGQMARDERERSEALHTAERGCLEARALTKQLLAFAKGGSPVKQPGDVGRRVRESVELTLSSDVDVRLELDDDLREVQMDEVQIGQVVGNLLVNAAQAIDDGGTITVTARDVEDEDLGPAVSIRVRDTGRGIPADAVEQVFDPFYTTKAEHSGLGLATSYWIVQRHEGRLELLETSARGTTFEVLLPACPAGDPDGPAIASSERDEHGGLRLLLMDDEDHVRHTVSKMLRTRGLEVDCAASGEEALAAFEEARRRGTPYDGAFLDLTVRGGMGGLETLRRLQALEPGFPAVVISGYSDDPVLADHRSYGFAGRLEKPFRIDQLEGALATLPRRTA